MGDRFAKHVCKMQDQAFHRKNKEAWKIGMKSSFATLFLPFYSPYAQYLHNCHICAGQCPCLFNFHFATITVLTTFSRVTNLINTCLLFIKTFRLITNSSSLCYHRGLYFLYDSSLVTSISFLEILHNGIAIFLGIAEKVCLSIRKKSS